MAGKDIQFAARDLQEALGKKGRCGVILPISKMPDKQEQAQLVLGLAHDDLLLKRLKAAGGKSVETSAPEGYAIRLTNLDSLMVSHP